MTSNSNRGPFDEPVRRQAADWFARLRGPRNPDDVARFEAWLAEDPSHGVAYDRLRRTSEQTMFLANSDLGRSRRLRRAGVFERRPGVGYAAAAASVAALAVLGWSMVGDGRGPTFTELEQIASADSRYATKVGEIRAVSLSDGSRLTLDTASVVRVAYTATNRTILLERGRARFEVAHDAKRPFRVVAEGREVVARGTIFDVALTEAAVEVFLLRGSVDVGAPVQGTGKIARMRLHPGQHLEVPARAQDRLPTPIEAPVPQWPTGMLIFAATPLETAIAELNRYGVSQIEVVGEARFRKVSGAFRAGDAVAFATAMAKTFDLVIEQRPDGRIRLSVRTHEAQPQK